MKSCKGSPTVSGLGKINLTRVETGSTIMWELLKVLGHGNKMSLKFVETRILWITESICSPISRQNICSNKEKYCFKRKHSNLWIAGWKKYY